MIPLIPQTPMTPTMPENVHQRFGDSIAAVETDGWVHLRQRLPCYRETPAELTRALTVNATIPGPSKLALAPDGAIEARAELPAAIDAHELETVVDGFRFAAGAGDAPRTSPAEPIDLAAVEALLTDNGRSPRRVSDATLVVPLPTTPPHVAELASTPTAWLRLSVPVADAHGWSDSSRGALALFLMRVNATVRWSRAVLDGGAARFELCLMSAPLDRDSEHALVALEALELMTHFHIREARALEDLELARLFLSSHQPERRSKP